MLTSAPEWREKIASTAALGSRRALAVMLGNDVVVEVLLLE